MNAKSVYQHHPKKCIAAGIVLALLLAAISFAVANKIAPVAWLPWGPVNNAGGIAMNGYDPVSYWHDGGPAEGDPDRTVEWKGVTWRFSSDENLSLFQEDPARYAPQFGGYCALAVSAGFTADATPDAWLVDSGKLYLFNGTDPKKDWLADATGDIALRAEATWGGR